MKRTIMWVSLLSLALAIGGCKKEQTEDPAATETTEVQAEGVQVKVGPGGTSVDVKTGEGTVNIKTGEGGASVKATTEEGSADVKTDESGATVKAKSGEGSAAVKAKSTEGSTVRINQSGKAVRVKTPGQGGVIIQRGKGRMKVNVGGLNVNVPDTDDDDE